jgi:hypothetical protein
MVRFYVNLPWIGLRPGVDFRRQSGVKVFRLTSIRIPVDWDFYKLAF